MIIFSFIIVNLHVIHFNNKGNHSDEMKVVKSTGDKTREKIVIREKKFHLALLRVELNRYSTGMYRYPAHAMRLDTPQIISYKCTTEIIKSAKTCHSIC
jgi:hypothetical protein